MSLKCMKCHSANPEGQRFCGQCGSAITASVREQIQAILKEETKDQSVLELETAQRVVARLSDWAKLFGVVVGVPLALLGVVLAIMGIKTYSDFASGIEAAKKEAIQKMQSEAIAKVQEVTKASQDLSAEIKLIRADVEANRNDLTRLSTRVKGIEERIEFKTSVSPDLQGKLQGALTAFQQYFKRLGFQSPTDKVTIDVSTETIPGATSYYLPDTNTLVIDKAYAKDTDILLREYSHHVLYSSASRAMAAADPKGTWAYLAIESGLANYFVCSAKDSPSFGEATSRQLHQPVDSWSLRNNRKISELKPDVGSALSDGSQIWGGAFWDLRRKFGPELIDRLLYRTWRSIEVSDVESNDPKRFLNKLLESSAQELGAEPADQVKSILNERGMDL